MSKFLGPDCNLSEELKQLVPFYEDNLKLSTALTRASDRILKLESILSLLLLATKTAYPEPKRKK